MLTVCSLEVHVVSMVQQSDMVNVEWFILRSKENNLFLGGRRGGEEVGKEAFEKIAQEQFRLTWKCFVR